MLVLEMIVEYVYQCDKILLQYVCTIPLNSKIIKMWLMFQCLIHTSNKILETPLALNHI
jgi:hypothetical protein